MLLTRSGQRAGTISGGCLEAEVAKKTWWLTEKGPTVQRYSSFFDDDSPMPYGLGCGGTVYVSLQRGAAVRVVMNALESTLTARVPCVMITDTDSAATLLVQQANGDALFSTDDSADFRQELKDLAQRAVHEKHSFYAMHDASQLFVEYVAPCPALTIFGAGDDAKPLADFAKGLGWHVTVADGRSHLVRADRFPQADRLITLNYEDALHRSGQTINPEDTFVLLTHSYDQDRILLRELVPRRPRYIGVLGPRQRTERLVGEIASQIDMSAEECMSLLHAPVGFDIGAHTPESIALSIVTEIVAVLNGREGMSLKKQPRKHIHSKLYYV